VAHPNTEVSNLLRRVELLSKLVALNRVTLLSKNTFLTMKVAVKELGNPTSLTLANFKRKRRIGMREKPRSNKMNQRENTLLTSKTRLSSLLRNLKIRMLKLEI